MVHRCGCVSGARSQSIEALARLLRLTPGVLFGRRLVARLRCDISRIRVALFVEVRRPRVLRRSLIRRRRRLLNIAVHAVSSLIRSRPSTNGQHETAPPKQLFVRPRGLRRLLQPPLAPDRAESRLVEAGRTRLCRRSPRATERHLGPDSSGVESRPAYAEAHHRGGSRSVRGVVVCRLIHLKVHLQIPCYDFYTLLAPTFRDFPVAPKRNRPAS